VPVIASLNGTSVGGWLRYARLMEQAGAHGLELNLYQVAADPAGRVADGYGVQDQPWFVLTSATGKVIWKHDGWLGIRALEAAARRA